MKLYEIIDSKEALKKLYETSGLSFKTALEVAKNIRKTDEVLEVYEHKRKDLIMKHAEKDENGNPVEDNGNYKIADIPSFKKEFEELVNQDADPDIEKIKAEELENVSTLTPFEVSKILFMIEE